MAQQQNNYFTTMIKRYNGNGDFVNFLKPEQIQRSAKERIFREMVRGQIDYSIFGIYFEDPKFLENLIVACENELSNYSTVAMSLDFFDSYYPGNNNVIFNKNRYNSLVQIYTVLRDKLFAVKITGNVGCLTDIQYILKDLSKIL